MRRRLAPGSAIFVTTMLVLRRSSPVRRLAAPRSRRPHRSTCRSSWRRRQAPRRRSSPVPVAGSMPTPTAALAGPCSCAGNLYNSPNFTKQRSAQACIAWCLDQVGYDIHRLDGDNDGVACESLP